MHDELVNNDEWNVKNLRMQQFKLLNVFVRMSLNYNLFKSCYVHMKWRSPKSYTMEPRTMSLMMIKLASQLEAIVLLDHFILVALITLDLQFYEHINHRIQSIFICSSSKLLLIKVSPGHPEFIVTKCNHGRIFQLLTIKWSVERIGHQIVIHTCTCRW